MNSNAISKAATVVIGMLIALRVISGVLSGGGNSLGNLYSFLAVGFLLVGVLNPKQAFYLLVLMTAFLDFFKRLLILDGSVSFVDLYYVLGIAPLTLLGVCVGIAVNMANGRIPLRRTDVFLFVIAIGLFGTSAIFALMGKSGGAMGTLGNLANESAYVCLLFVVPILFRSTEEIRKLFRFIVLTFVPVALYLFYQSRYGITDWELDYLLSGLSLEVRQLDEHVFRPFSTMNSAGNVSMMMCLLAVVGLSPIRKGLGGRGRWSPSGIIFACTFVLAAYLTYSRGGWIGGGIALVALVALSRPLFAGLSYAASVVAFLILLFSAGHLLKDDKMRTWSSKLMSRHSSYEEAMALRLETMNSRLKSLDKTVKHPERWTPFGVFAQGVELRELSGGAYDSKYYVHDGFSDTLLRFGYIPMAIGLFVFVRVLLRVHRFQYSLPPKSLDRRLVTLCLALLAGIGISFIANSAQIRTYPVNFYFYLFIASPISIALGLREARRSEEAERASGRVAGEPDSPPAPHGRGLATAG